MSIWSNIVDFVDRDVIRWSGRPILPLLIGATPMLIWMFFKGRPGDAPVLALTVMIGFAAFWGGLGVWRSVQFDWQEFKRIRALGAAESQSENGNG